MDFHQVALARAGRFEICELLERALERRAENIALEQGQGHDEGVALLWSRINQYTSLWIDRVRTGSCGNRLEVYLKTDIVVRLRRCLQQRAVLALENVHDAVSNKLVPASNVHRQQQARLLLRRRQVESDAIIVDKLDVQRSRSGES